MPASNIKAKARVITIKGAVPAHKIFLDIRVLEYTKQKATMSQKTLDISRL